MRDSKTAKSIFVIVTTQCNLRCTYCYERNKSTSSAGFGTMQDRLAAELEDEGFNGFDVIFHGGEPFMAFETMKELSEWIWTQYPQKDIRCMATTNGTVLTDEMRRWLEANHERFEVTLSLDGGRETHNRNRCNSFDKIDFAFFRRLWPKHRVKMTIGPDSIGRMFDDIQEILAMGFRVNPSLAMEVKWDMDTVFDTLANELEKLVQYYLDHPDMEPCPMLSISPALMAHPESIPHNKACGAGTHVVAFDVNGNKYPCHSFITDFVEPYDSSKSNELFCRLQSEDGLSLSPRCKGCLIYPYCEPCYGMNQSRRGDMGNFDPIVCQFNKIKVKAAASMYAQMILSGKKYKPIQDADKQTLNDIILGITNIQKI